MRSNRTNRLALVAFFSIVFIAFTASMMQTEDCADQGQLQDVQARTSACALSITGIEDVAGRGTYIGGETFTVRVHYANTGDLAALTVDGTLTFNGYGYLTSTNPASVNVLVNSTAHQDFMVTASAGATSAAITIDCEATGVEDVTSLPLYVESNDNDLDLAIQRQATLAITSMVDRTGTAPYWYSDTFVVRVTYQNTGGTDAQGVDGMLSFNGYTHLIPSNPTPVTVGADSTAFQDFTVVVDSSPTAALVEIDTTVFGTEALSGRPLSEMTTASTDLHVQIGVAAAIVTITSIQDVTGRGTYVGGESFTVRVNYANSGLYGAAMDGTLVYNGYGHLTSSNPSAASVPAQSTGYQLFTVTASPGATGAAVTIDCSATGAEQYTGRTLYVDSYNNDLDLTIQAQANVTITAMEVTSPRAVPGPYVGGESIVLRVTFTNTGGTAASVDAVPDDGPYTGIILANSPAAVLVAAGGGTSFQDFNFPILSSAATAAVNITAYWTGTEMTSGRAIAGASSVIVNIQSQAAVSIVALAIASPRAAPGPYGHDEVLTLRVTFSNTGDTAATVDAAMDDGAYTDLSWDDPAAVIVGGASTNTQDFTITVASFAVFSAVTITVTWSGTEAISNCTMSGDAPADTMLVNISSPPNSVSITALSVMSPRPAPGPYVGGEAFTLRVTFSNTGGTAATVDSILDDGTYLGLTWSNPAAVFVAAGGTSTQDFTVNVAAGAETAAVTLAATWTGTEQGTGNPLSGDTPADTINVNIQARASVTITNMAITMPRPAPGPYIGGEMLSLSVTFFNAGGTAATVDSTLDDGPYTGLVFGFDPAAVVVASNTTYTQVFGVEILPGAQTATVTITATWAGTEAVTGREISGGPDTLLVDIKAQAVLTIPGSPLYMTGNGTYVAGTTFVVRVLLNNPATSAKAQAVTVALAGLVAGVTANASASKTVSGTTSIDFVITIAAGTASQALSLTATASGSEEITGRSLGAGPSSAMSITIKAQATLEITGFTWMTGNGTYVAGTTFVVRVSLSNPSTSAKAHSVTAPLSFGGATGLSANISVSKTISGAGYIDLSITIAAGAPGQPSVTVTTTVTGTEEISGRALGPLVTVLNITIEAASTLEITSLAITTPRAAPGPYVAGESFTLRVTFSNTGALAVTVDASIDAGVYTGLSWNNPAAVVVAAGGTSMQDFTVNVAAGADTAAVTLAATWNGTEDGTGNPLSGGSPSLLVNILAQAELAITGAPTFQTGNGTYVAGTTLVLRVAINNPAASARAQGVTAALVGLVAGVTANSSASRTVSGASHIDFLITIAAGVASQALSISAIVSGNEEYTGRALVAGPSPALNINIKAQSSLNIINVVDMTGAAPYWHGESFVVRVSYQNAGGTDVQGVDGVLGFNGYPFLSSSNPPAITVSAGSTTYQDFTITVGWVATAAMVEIGATVAGQEGITGRTLSDATNASTVLQLQVNGTWDISISITLTIHLDQVGVGQEVVWAAIITYQNLTVVQYAWDFGDGTVSAEPSPSHAYVEPGAYLVTLIVTFDNGLNVTAMMAIIAVKNQDMTYIYVLIIILAVGSVAVALGFSYKRVAIKREGTKWPGGKPSKHAHSSRYVDSAAIEQEDPRTGTVAPALPDATGGEHLEPETGPLGTPARAPGLDRRARVMAPDVVEFINKLDVPEDVKGEILGEIKAMPPEEQRVYLASIFVKEWETGDG